MTAKKRGKTLRDAAFMGIMRNTLLTRLRNELHIPVQNTYGYITKLLREQNDLTFSPRLKQGDSCINHHCTATEAVASYTMSDRRYFPCVPRYGMY